MFVLDGVRRFADAIIRIPRFHTGHLGFVPGLEVSTLTGDRDSNGQEVTLTPFQDQRNHLFLLKCVFRDDVGVVLKALSAFAVLKVNVMSLESATINRGKNHVLFCILSWSSSRYTTPTPMSEGMQQKFMRFLPLLPNADERYLLLLQMLFLFCHDALDHEDLQGQASLPKIQIRLFDALEEQGAKWGSLVLKRDESAKRREPRVIVDLSQTSIDEQVILLSETETKTLRLVFASAQRANKFLRVAFHHDNQPGALLAIATLLKALRFTIVTSLLRKGDNQRNVWEMTLEHEKALPVRAGSDADWFRATFQQANLPSDLKKHLHYYKVSVCSPIYPKEGDASHFVPRSLLEGQRLSAGAKIEVIKGELDKRLKTLKGLQDRSEWGPIVNVIHSDLCRRRRDNDYKAVVFLSLPAACSEHKLIIEKQFAEKLRLKIVTHLEGDSEDIVDTAFSKIRGADYFFALWHPEEGRPDSISPWMPFEFGAARSMGKKLVMMFHKKLPKEVKHRIDPSTSRIEYTDLTFQDDLATAIAACRKLWLWTQNDLTIDV